MTYICQVDTKAALWQFAGSIKRPNGVASKIGRVFMTVPHRCANTAEKLRGTKVLVPTPGRLRPTPGQRPGWVLGAGLQEGVVPSRCEGPWVSPPENFLKTQMLNPAFWWLLAVKFLAFWKPRPRSWGTNRLLVPNLKVGDQSPRSHTIVAPMRWPVCLTNGSNGSNGCMFYDDSRFINSVGSPTQFSEIWWIFAYKRLTTCMVRGTYTGRPSNCNFSADQHCRRSSILLCLVTLFWLVLTGLSLTDQLSKYHFDPTGNRFPSLSCINTTTTTTISTISTIIIITTTTANLQLLLLLLQPLEPSTS